MTRRSSTPRSTRVLAIGIVGLVIGGALLVWGLVSSAGSPAGESSSAVPFSTPSRSEIARRAGIAFPDSTTKFESVKAADELHVVCTIAARDVAAFESGSKLALVAGKRVVIHASPIWDLNPTGQISGGSSRFGAIERQVEVAVDGSVATIRMVLTNA